MEAQRKKCGPRVDPEVRGRCWVCSGPVFVDEQPGACPDCKETLRQIQEVHQVEPPSPSLPKIYRSGM